MPTFVKSLKALPTLTHNARGNVATVFALTLVPIAAMLGFTLDISRATAAKQHLQAALDSAALAVAREPTLSAEALKQHALTVLGANLSDGLGMQDVAVTNVVVSPSAVRVEATGSIETVAAGLLGLEDMSVHAVTEVRRATKKLQLALVLDNTGSMGGTKIQSLRTAALDLVSILYGNQQTSNTLEVAVVPFVTGVNIKNDKFKMTWMDQLGQAAHHGENFDESANQVNHFTLFQQMGVTWKGCVEARVAPFDETDAPTNLANPNTLFVPYLWPDEPNNGSGNSFANNYYSNDFASGTQAQRQASTAKYTRAPTTIDELPSATTGPNKACPEPLTWFTNDRRTIESALRAMSTWNNSGTNNAEGLAWGWRILSPGEPFDNPVPFNDAHTEKALVLMTDGVNEVVAQSSFNISDYSPYGYVAKGRLGTTNRTTAVTRVNERTGRMCAALKELGVTIYTITFQLNDANAKTLFRNCASQPAYYFDAVDGGQLRAAFQEIGADVTDLRISH